LALNQLVYRGVSTWLEWYQSLLKGRVVNALVELTEDRLAAIERRVDDGDLAAIALTEYRVTLLQRQLLAQEAAQNLQIAEQRLAYFWAASDESDADQAASLESGGPDPELRWPYQFDAIDAQARNSLVAEHPSMEVLQATLEQAQNQRRQAVNEVLPALDLEMRVAQDMGDGPEYLDGTESIVGLSFSMPLGQRAAKARTAIAEARIRELEYEQLVMQQRLLRDLSVATTALATARDILVTSQQREVLAKQLQAQEQVRFFEGVSDQFLLISREKAALQASMQRIDAELDILRHELVIHATLARLY
jgi:outer membrane protein TolC